MHSLTCESVECSISRRRVQQIAKDEPLSYFSNGRIKIEIKFRAKATRERKFNRFFSSDVQIFWCFEISLSWATRLCNVNQLVN